MELCDRIGVLDHGRLLAVGRPAQLASALTRDTLRVWLGDGASVALERLCALGIVASAEELGGQDGEWREFAIVVPEGHDGAAEVVRALVTAGVDVARIERVPVSAADIIERVLARSATEKLDA